MSVSKILREFGKKTGLGNKPNELWSKLSNDWCHALGIIAKAIEHLEKHSMKRPLRLGC